jgi:nucleoside-diphosphate-sugar epimerase
LTYTEGILKMGYKILITGGAGFVGRHFIRFLLERGDEVHCVDNLAAYTGAIDPRRGWPLFNPVELPNFHFYHEDCRLWFKRISDTDFDYAFHLAAMVGGRLMIENYPLAIADDLSIDAEYWQWAARCKPAKTICFSSSAAYPIKFQTREHYTLLKEDMIDFSRDLGIPDFTYGWAKLTHEYLARMAYHKHGLRSVIYRPFSGYGEDQDDSYPFPGICKRILANKSAKTITVWGTGDQSRDFIHIDDCVRGIITTMDKIDNGEALNLSTGILTSFKDFAIEAANLCGFNPEVHGTSDKPEGVFARCGDTQKQMKYGFQHTIPLQEGIRRALRYFEEFSNQNRLKKAA